MAKKKLAPTQYVQDLVGVLDSQFLRALAEPVRIEIIKFLLINGRSDISTVAGHIDKDRSVLSRHLHLLEEIGILRSEKVSRNTFFEIDEESFRTKTFNLFSIVDRALKNCC